MNQSSSFPIGGFWTELERGAARLWRWSCHLL